MTSRVIQLGDLSHIYYRIIEEGAIVFLSFFIFFFPFFSHSSRLLAAGFRSSSSRRQHAEIECRESSVDKSFFLFYRIVFFFFRLSEMTIVSMGACRCCAASCKHSCRAATSVRTMHLFAGRIRSSELRGTRVKAERPTNVTRDESAKVVIGSRNPRRVHGRFLLGENFNDDWRSKLTGDVLLKVLLKVLLSSLLF